MIGGSTRPMADVSPKRAWAYLCGEDVARCNTGSKCSFSWILIPSNNYKKARTSTFYFGIFWC